jgi:23S rRNA (cytosine1962-C5)-methyltransferase
MNSIKVFLRPGKEVAVQRLHPWIFSGAIARTEGKPNDGDIATVYDRNGNALGTGHFHHGSIAVRLLAFEAADLNDGAFWDRKLQTALHVRQMAGLGAGFGNSPGHESTNCFRLVHGEGDGLSGLIIDVYGDTAVVQCHSIGMHRQRQIIAESLHRVLGPALAAVYDKSAEALPPKYAENQSNGYLSGESRSGSGIVLENGVQFRVDWEHGQKTGFFLDQRDNRLLLGKFAPGKTVLNAFCYTGGFSAYALKAGAKLVHSVDVSAKAMELTEENIVLNVPGTDRHVGYTEDVLRFLKNTEQFYDVMVIDPPAFAKSLEKRHNAVQGYKRLNEAAIRKVSPGGILFTFSCSQVVDSALFYHTIVSAALEVGRPARVLHHMTQGADHPVSLFHPEGSYLKGLVLYIE